jgi:23S rRNA U2552 (ribose-2'-O)-methylase RlmE/FtsJ
VVFKYSLIKRGSTAVDLLRAPGMHLDEAAGELDGAVRNAF